MIRTVPNQMTSIKNDEHQKQQQKTKKDHILKHLREKGVNFCSTYLVYCGVSWLLCGLFDVTPTFQIWCWLLKQTRRIRSYTYRLEDIMLLEKGFLHFFTCWDFEIPEDACTQHKTTNFWMDLSSQSQKIKSKGVSQTKPASKSKRQHVISRGSVFGSQNCKRWRNQRTKNISNPRRLYRPLLCNKRTTNSSPEHTWQTCMAKELVVFLDVNKWRNVTMSKRNLFLETTHGKLVQLPHSHLTQASSRKRTPQKSRIPVPVLRTWKPVGKSSMVESFPPQFCVHNKFWLFFLSTTSNRNLPKRLVAEEHVSCS